MRAADHRAVRKADIRVENHGSIVLLKIESDVAEAWIESTVDIAGSYQPHWPFAVVVEPRYVVDILRGAVEAGLRVR